MTLSISVLSLAIGLIALVAGAEMIVRGASALARWLGISNLVIGLTVVAAGTSAPEIAVAITASMSGHSDTGLGNVIGSNIFNLLCVLGALALVAPLVVRRRIVRFDMPLLIGFSALLLVISLNGLISLAEGVLLAGLLVGVTIYSFKISQSDEETVPVKESRAISKDPQTPIRRVVIPASLLLIGLAGVSFGSNWVVDGASAIATRLGLSELIVGLTIIAIGTSLPELATALSAARHDHLDVAAGNAIGSCVFNILGVVAAMAIVSDTSVSVSDAIQQFDMPMMLIAVLLCFPIAYTGYRISRREGIILLLGYVGYLVFLVLDAMAGGALKLSP